LKNPITVLIAENHQLYSDMLKGTLSASGIQCLGQVTDGQSLINVLKDGIRPDIVLLDLSMPILDGNRALPILNSAWPQIKVIVISQYDDPFLINNYYQRGVKAFIPKTQHLEKLVEAIHIVASNKKYHCPASTDLRIIKKPRFTKRELDTIKLIVDGKTNKEISDELFVSIKTVEVDRAKIYEKANVKSLAEFLRFVSNSGWYFLEEAQY
jgi:DNA-binding NarL/FixJ family response regulator